MLIAVLKAFLAENCAASGYRPLDEARGMDAFDQPEVARMSARDLADLPLAQQRRTWPGKTRWELCR